jgi:hypothetical protein
MIETSIFTSTNNGTPSPTQPEQVRNYTLSYNANDYLTESKYTYEDIVPAPVGQTPVFVTKTSITKYFYE